MMDSHNKGAASQRITAITIKQQNIAINKATAIGIHVSVMSLTTFWPSCVNIVSKI